MRRRRSPLVSATIDLYGGSRAAVTIAPSPSRWPGREGSDRLLLPLWLAALTLEDAGGPIEPRIRHGIMKIAQAVVGDPLRDDREPSWAEAVAGRELVPTAGVGQPRIVLHLTRSSDGAVATVVDSDPSALALAAATAALSAVALTSFDSESRLSAALALEGLLAAHRHLVPGQQPPQGAVRHALRYAVLRLEEAGRPVPEHLLAAALVYCGGRP